MDRKIYFKMKSLKEAKSIFLNHFVWNSFLMPEEIETNEAIGRVTAEPIWAKLSIPFYHSAAMDGIATIAELTYGATENNPIRLKENEDFVWIDTGHPLPENTNTVIMVEDLHQVEKGVVEIVSAAYPWQHVRKVGEDIVATELLIPQHHELTPYDAGGLLGSGITRVKVLERPRIAIIPTGRELVYPEDVEKGKIRPGDIIEFNSVVLSELVKRYGGDPRVFPIIPDDEDALRSMIRDIFDKGFHMVITNAGSSSGRRDHTFSVIDSLGKVLVHGVAIMPGKPTILGDIDGRPVIGSPGYPVSSVISFYEFILPAIRKMFHLPPIERESIVAYPAKKIPSKAGIEEFIRVTLGEVDNRIIANPLPRQAGSISTLIKADGLLRISAEKEGVTEEESVKIELIGEKRRFQDTIVIIGSHDNTLDLIIDMIHTEDDRIRVVSSNVGSLGGLIALRRGNAHVAGSHLLDPETGEYNFSYIERYLKDKEIKVVNLVLREQGLMTLKRNPLKISGLKDLTRKDVRFINRQLGSGTRVLLDYQLEQLGISPDEINGYETEEYTHMNVGIAILSGMADVGLGIYAAAKALDLHFIPVIQERYDLIIPSKYWDDRRIQVLLSLIRREDFKEKVRALGGYDTSLTGQIMSQ